MSRSAPALGLCALALLAVLVPLALRGGGQGSTLPTPAAEGHARRSAAPDAHAEELVASTELEGSAPTARDLERAAPGACLSLRGVVRKRGPAMQHDPVIVVPGERCTPLAGARVTVGWSDGGGRGHLDSVVTDRHGEWALSVPLERFPRDPSRLALEVVARAAGLPSRTIRRPGPADAAEVLVFEHLLEPRRVVRGRAVDDLGRPLVHAEVALLPVPDGVRGPSSFSSIEGLRDETDAEGRFVLSSAPPADPEASVQVVVRCLEAPLAAHGSPIPWSELPAELPPFVVDLSEWAVDGHLTCGTGEPAADVRVVARVQGHTIASGSTDAGGAFRVFPLTPGSEISIEPDLLLPVRLARASRQRLSAPARDVELRLTTPTVAVRLLDADERPIVLPLLAVAIGAASERGPGSAPWTPVAGHALVFGFPPGAERLEVYLDGQPNGPVWTIERPAAPCPFEVTLRLAPPGAR